MLSALTVSLLAATPTLAAPGLNCSGVNAVVCDAYLEHFVANMTAKGIKVVTKANVTEVLTVERQKELLGCNDGQRACIAELAGALGVGSILSGSVAKLESGYVSTLKVISAEDGSTSWSATARIDDERALFGFLDEQSRRLVDHLIPPAPTPFVRFVPAIVGGVLFAAGLAMRIGAETDAAALRAFIDGKTELTSAEVRTLLDRGSGLQLFGAVAMGVGAASALGSLVWILVGGPPEPLQKVSIVPTLGGAFATLSWELP